MEGNRCSRRVRSLLRCDQEGTPILLWKHFRTDDPLELAELTAEFYKSYALSGAKVMPDIPVLFSESCLSSWSQVAQLRRFGPIETVGRAKDYVRAVKLTRDRLDSADPLLVTVFSPLASIALWCGPEALHEMVRGDRSVAHNVLNALGGMTAALAERCVEAGADAVYYSCWGQDVLSAEQYQEFGVPYDLAGLEGASAANVRFLHVHGGLHAHVDRYADYPVEVVGWSEMDSRVSLLQGASALPDKVVMGGISERWTGHVERAALDHVLQLVEALGPRYIAGPGCSLPDAISDEDLRTIRGIVSG